MSDDKSVSFKDTVENKNYGVIDIHKLGFELLKENKKQYALLLLKLVLAVGLYIIAFLLFIVSYGKTIGAIGKLNMFSSLEPILWFRTPSGLIGASIGLSVVLVILLIVVILWLCGRTVTDINTGIDIIETKKVSSSKVKTFFRTLALFLIGAFITFLFSISYMSSAYYISRPMNSSINYMMSIYNLIMIVASQIILLIVYLYLLFMFIDIIAKGSTIKNSAKNVYINFVYSKNKIIKKVLTGVVLNIAALVVINILFTLCFFIVMNISITSHILVGISSIIIAITIFLVSVFYLQYMYLVYMLNEVDETKYVKEVAEVKKSKKSTIIIGSIVILISMFFIQHSYSVYMMNEAKNQNNKGIDMREPTEITEPTEGRAVEAIEVK